MNIKYTKHAQKKFADFREFGIRVTKGQIASVLAKPKHKSQDNSNLIKSGNFDARHNLRVVHKRTNHDIIVITFYIYRKGRYGED